MSITILGGIYSRFFTPVEASIVAVLYAAFVGAFGEFADDVRSGAFPQAAQLAQADQRVVAELHELIANDMSNVPLPRR